MAAIGRPARSQGAGAAPTVVVDLDGRIVRVSDSLLGLVARAREDVEGRSFVDLVHPDDVGLANAAGRAALAGERQTHVEQRYVAGNGRTLWVLVDIEALCDADGVPRELRCTVRDVTAERRVAEAARADRDDYRRLVEETRDGVWVLDADARTASVSGAVTELLGYSEEELRGRHPWEFTDDEGAAILRAGVARRQQGTTESYDAKWIARDGRTVWTLTSAAPILDEDGRFQGSLALITDVTQRRLADEQRRRLAAIVESSHDAVFGLDRDGRVIDVNAAGVELCGVPAEEIEGRPLREVLVPPEGVDTEQALARILDGEDVPPADSHATRPDGRRLFISVSFGPIRDAGGAVVGASLVARDVTEARHAARRLSRLAQQQEAVARLGHRALAAAPIELLEREAVEVVSDVIGAPIVAVLEAGADGEQFRVRAAHGVPAEVIGLLVPASAGPPLADMAGGEAIVVSDWERETRFARPLIGVEMGIVSSAGVPLTGGCRHAMLSAHRTRAWEPHPDEIAFLHAVANVLAAARERVETEEAMRRQALHDPLTGLPNRTLVTDRLTHALERARDRGTTTGLCVLDVDQFKAINDSLGHTAGDELLRELGPRLAGVVRPSDTVGRLGSDEFVVICEDVADPAEAGELAPRLVAAISEPVTIAGEEHVMTASAGIAFDTGGELSAGELLRNADAAMNRAKERGRARIEIFGEELLERTVGRLRLERDLRGALGREEHWLAFQPIVSLVDGRVVGLEALLRWRHPVRGEVSPGDFIPVAEDSGLIEHLGAWVLRRACEHAAHWDTAVQVNVSPRQFDDDHLPALVERTLAETGLPADRLTLEITEGTVMDPGSDPVDVLLALRELGVHLVLDDFGTGYSSLHRLRGLPIDGLKIDRSFVEDLTTPGSPSELLVGGVVRVCAALGVGVVAEGVETDAQRDQLARLGCLLAQGFLLARPMPAEAVARHLSRSP